MSEFRRVPGPGMTFTPEQRRQLATRLMLQAPRDLSPRQIKAVADDLDRRVRGLPPGAFMALDALRLLADAGNVVAEDLFIHESQRLGLTSTFFSQRPD